MNRRTLICCLGSLLAGLPSFADAQSPRRGPWWAPLRGIPSIAVVSAEDDSRLPAVREAVEFWNSELSTLGTPLRFDAIRHIAGTIPVDDLSALRADLNPLLAKESGFFRSPPDSIRLVNDDVIVALSDASFSSFAFGWPHLQKVLVVIQRTYLLTLPNVARNVVAHEFGHAIGLSHNDEANALMCGGKWCHSTFPNEGFFPLTPADKARLLELYPPGWRDRPLRRWREDPPPSARISG